MMAGKGNKDYYDKCEEALGKNSTDDCESGISCASEAIEKSKDDAKLYLLRAKLSLKLLVISQLRGKIDERIKNCLGDCEQAIAIIERGVLMPDSTTVKIDALKLGYICCERLKSNHKRGEFEHRLSELNITMPKNTDQIRNELLQLGQPQGTSMTNGRVKLRETMFPKVSFIDPSLLEDVIRCYKDRQTVCRNCYYNNNKLSRGYDAKGQCTSCKWEFKKLLVIPKSPMTINYYESEMIAIPPWPKSKPNDLPFEACAKPKDKSNDHKRCLIMSRNSAVWYAHTVEELVIWTVEREYECSFEEFIRDLEPVHSATVVATELLPYQNLDHYPVNPVQQVPAAAMYYPPVITCQAGVTGYMEPQAFVPATTIPCYFPPSYQVPATTFYSAPVTIPRFQTESMVQQFDNMTFSSPPISPVVIDDNQQPVASTTANNEDTVSE
ncbi:uncharacterized protein [Dysidea avara]|uniref:uncharacterized protein isoform X3 n=1 Tax=Dysidea avara TaxID=196820 RepID=UPI003323C29D